MLIVFASRTGNVEMLVSKLGHDALRIETGSESVSEPFVLFTYTDGYGDVPPEVDGFLANNAHLLQGVVVSGSQDYGDAYCKAGDVIAEMYNVDVLYRVENDGTDQDVAAIQEVLPA